MQNNSNNYNSGDHHSDPARNNNKMNNNGFDDKISLKYLFSAFNRHKGFILSTIFICMAVAMVWSYYAPRIYQSSGSLMINESPKKSSLKGSELTNLLNKTYGIGSNSTLSNELQFLRSRQISLNMADDLLKHPHMENGEIYPVLWKKYPEDSTLVGRDTVATRIRNNISFGQVDRNADLIKVNYESRSPRAAAHMVDLAMETYKETSTKRNRKTANSAVEFLEKERNRLKKKLSNSEQQLRSFMNRHNVVKVDAQTQELISRLSKLESERQSVKADLVAAKSAIKDYENRLDNIKPGLSERYSEATGPLLDRYQYQLAELQTKKTLMLSKNPGLEKRKNPPSSYKKLNSQIQYMKNKINKLTKKLTAKDGDYLGTISGSEESTSKNISQIQQKLIELRTKKSQYEAKMDVLDKRLKKQHQFFNNLPDNMMDLAKMKRDRQINEEMYRKVSEQYNQMVLWQKTQFGLGRVIDDGYIPEKPSKPNTKLYLLISAILGGMLSVGYLTFKNAVNTDVDGIEMLKNRGYPIMAIIPVLKKATKRNLPKDKVEVLSHDISPELISVLDPISPGAEAFRRMNYNLVYSNPGQEKCRTILITSSTNSEGKTTVSSNLGVVLSESKKKVIIVDTDLGRPNLHNMFGMERSPGLVDVIRGDVQLKDAIQSSVVANVDILSSGSQSHNPAAINQDPQFEYLLENLKMNYDFVLIDTAPYGIVTDAAPIMKLVDDIIVVARFKKTKEVELDHTLEDLEKIRANIRGFAITAFDPNKSNGYYNSSTYYRSAYEDYYSHTKNMM